MNKTFDHYTIRNMFYTRFLTVPEGVIQTMKLCPRKLRQRNAATPNERNEGKMSSSINRKKKMKGKASGLKELGRGKRR